MITLTFILIAYFIRKKYLPEDATRGERVFYYIMCVVATPLLGPLVYKIMTSTEPPTDKNKGKVVGTYPGFL
jgi:hypothetical protein